MGICKTVRLNVKGYRTYLDEKIRIYQNDSFKLRFIVEDCGIQTEQILKNKGLNISNLTATLFIETPNEIDTLEQAKVVSDMIEFNLTNKYTQHIGTSRMQIQLKDDDDCIYTLPEFTFEVKKNIYDATEIQNVTLIDEEDNNVIDEYDNRILVEHSVSLVEGYKQIKDFALKSEVVGTEDLLIQDNGVTKRIKTGSIKGTQDLTSYYTKEEINSKLSAKSNATHNHDTVYASKNTEHIHTNKTTLDKITDGKLTEWDNKSEFDGDYTTLKNKPAIPSLEGYASETFVTTKIAEAQLDGGNVDLSGYATKEDLNFKVDTIPDKGLSTNDFTNEEKSKLETLNNYTHPETHEATTIVQDETHRFVTDNDKASWDNKSDFNGSYDALTNKPIIPVVDVNKEYVDAEISKIQQSGNIVLRDIQIGEVFNVAVPYGNIVISKESIIMTEDEITTFTVKLDKKPIENQTVNLSSNNVAVVIDTATLIFTPTNYNTEQVVTISTTDDVDENDDVCVITLSSSGVQNKSVNVTVKDDDVTENVFGEIIVSKNSANISEGGSHTFTIKLDKSPTNDQVVTVTSNNEGVTLSPTQLTFTPSNYSIEQVVTIATLIDEDTINDNASILITSANVSNKTINVTISDNDIPSTDGLSKLLTIDEQANSFCIPFNGIGKYLTTGFQHKPVTNYGDISNWYGLGIFGGFLTSNTNIVSVEDEAFNFLNGYTSTNFINTATPAITLNLEKKLIYKSTDTIEDVSYFNRLTSKVTFGLSNYTIYNFSGEDIASVTFRTSYVPTDFLNITATLNTPHRVTLNGNVQCLSEHFYLYPSTQNIYTYTNRCFRFRTDGEVEIQIEKSYFENADLNTIKEFFNANPIKFYIYSEVTE